MASLRYTEMKSSVLLFSLTFIASLALVSSRPQLISLRHPESIRHSPQLPNSRPLDVSGPSANSRAKYSARPGDVVVHFDRNHEIQHLQYVLQNGQLASLYHRPPGNNRVPVQVQPPTELHRRDDGASPDPNSNSPTVSPSSPPPPAPPLPSQPGEPLGMPYYPRPTQQPHQVHEVRIDPDQTIEVLDSRDKGVSHIIGDHLTVSIPEHQYTNDENSKLDVLATVAVDALHNGVQAGEAKLHKAGIMLDKLRYKVSQKLHELPGIIDKKLRIKSSPGQVFLDQPGSRIVVVDNDKREPGSVLLEPDKLAYSSEIKQQLSPIEWSNQRLDDSP